MKIQIYCITNKINNKSYVGQSKNIKNRWTNHKRNAIKKYKCYAFQTALAKYGTENFIWQIIDEFNSYEDANEAEQFYISYLTTLSPNGYNLHRGGNNCSPTQETRKKISEKLKKTSYFITNPIHPNTGKKISEKRKKYLSNLFSGENGSGVKLTQEKVLQIYNEFLSNKNLTAKDLSKKYGVGKVTILNILHKKSWKEITKNLPDININTRQACRGRKSKLDDEIVSQIKIKAKNLSSNWETCKIIAKEFNISPYIIYRIIKNKDWKHVII